MRPDTVLTKYILKSYGVRETGKFVFDISLPNLRGRTLILALWRNKRSTYPLVSWVSGLEFSVELSWMIVHIKFSSITNLVVIAPGSNQPTFVLSLVTVHKMSSVKIR